jgi:general stress protein 26
MSQKKKQHFIELMRGFDNAMLVTHAPDGEMRARPMVIAEVTDSGDVFFVTHTESGKVDELLRDDRTLVTLQGKLKQASLTGHGTLIADRERLRDLWNPAWRIWFSGGPEDPNIGLIRVKPEEAEYWDMSGKTLATLAFRGLRAILTGETIEPPKRSDAHAQISL